MLIRPYLLVAIGGALGSVGRYWVTAAVAQATGFDFPWGTVLINISGSFAIGCFAALTAQSRQPDAVAWQAFAVAGLCGGFTTFSAFSLQTFQMLRAGLVGAAALNVSISVLACVGATSAGIWVCRN